MKTKEPHRRWSTGRIVLVLSLLLAGCQTMKDDTPVEGFDELFESAVTAFGEPYRQIRSEILAFGPVLRHALEDRRRSADWEVRLQADILAGWVENPEGFEYVRRVLQGSEPSLDGPRSPTGRPLATASAGALVGLGRASLPAILEVLYKEPDTRSEYAFVVATETILAWGDRSAAPVYRTLLLDSFADSVLRERAIRPFVALQEEARFEDLLTLSFDESSPPELRASALRALGTLGDPRAPSALEEVLFDTDTDLRLRIAAALGLGETGMPLAIDMLLAGYLETDEEQLKEHLIIGLGLIQDERAIASLHALRDEEEDLLMQDLIDEVLMRGVIF
jgi:HEAT repeat protein